MSPSSPRMYMDSFLINSKLSCNCVGHKQKHKRQNDPGGQSSIARARAAHRGSGSFFLISLLVIG